MSNVTPMPIPAFAPELKPLGSEAGAVAAAAAAATLVVTDATPVEVALLCDVAVVVDRLVVDRLVVVLDADVDTALDAIIVPADSYSVTLPVQVAASAGIVTWPFTYDG